MGRLVAAYKRHRSAAIRQIKATNTLALVLNETGEFMHEVVQSEGDYVPRFDSIDLDEAVEPPAAAEDLVQPVEPDEQGRAAPAAPPAVQDAGDVDELDEEELEEERKKARKEYKKTYDFTVGFKKFEAGENNRARQFSTARKVKKLDVRSRTSLLKTNTKLFVCTFLYCGEVRCSIEGIRMHCMRHSGKCYRCRGCDKKYYSYTLFKQCQDTHKVEEEAQEEQDQEEGGAEVVVFECAVCKTDMKTKTKLWRHRFTHATTPSIKCLKEGCPDPYIKHPTDKKRHFRNWHKITAVTKDMYIRLPENMMRYMTREEYLKSLEPEPEDDN